MGTASGGTLPIPPRADVIKNPSAGEEVLANRVGRCGLTLFDVRTRRHGNNYVFALFVIGLNHAKEKFVLVDAKLRRLADRQKRGMLVILGPNAVGDAIGLESVFLAEDLLRVLVLAIGAEDLSRQRLAILFRQTTGRGLHLHQHAFFVGGFVFRLQRQRDEHHSCEYAELPHVASYKDAQ